MHGTVHDLGEELESHPNCRCAAIPRTETMGALGEIRGETGIEVEAGADAFASLSDTDQRAILGNQLFQAYQDKRITLQDVVGQRYDAVWGNMRYARSARQVLGS
jgi:hypothetical protein